MRHALAFVLAFALVTPIVTTAHADLAPPPKKGGCGFAAPGGTAGFLAVAAIPGIALAILRRRRSGR